MERRHPRSERPPARHPRHSDTRNDADTATGGAQQRDGGEETEVAQRMKICKSFLSELENGHRHWTQARLDAFTKACNGR